ncbi:glycosyltransferase [Thiohalocapsa marina]|uniref:glycosyltransferase n=1 Tax=Thiohalocapsa marina TaxID=424902 RepID=UPI0036DCFEF1
MSSSDASPEPIGYHPRALFAVSSLGLGHATRSLVVIRWFLHRGYAVTLISAGNALAFLRLELEAEPLVTFQELADYPALERGTGWRFYLYLMLDLLRTWRLIRRERRQLQAVAGGYDFIFSDGRYGFHSRWTPSFILSHQIAFIPPHGLAKTAWISERLNLAALRRFDCLLIPDYPHAGANLTGQLAHVAGLQRCSHHFVGILSSYQRLDLAQDIDYLFVISGYLLEHKGSFVRSLLEQAADLPGNKVFILGAVGDTAASYAAFRRPDLQIHTVASGELRQTLFNRARCIVSRAGYTTIMDLVEHDKRAVLIPTPNQTEQEYLARHLGRLNHFVTREQGDDMDIAAALRDCDRTQRIRPPWRTAESLQRIDNAMAPLLHRQRFRIVLPAMGDTARLPAALEGLLGQRYPSDSFDILVVSDGPDDGIADTVRRYAEERPHGPRLRHRAAGRPREGASDASSVDWILFCDAKLSLGPHLLQQLNTWLNRHGKDVAAASTVAFPATSDGLSAWLGFGVQRLKHRLLPASGRVRLVRADLAGLADCGAGPGKDEPPPIKLFRRHGRLRQVPTDQVSRATPVSLG